MDWWDLPDEVRRAHLMPELGVTSSRTLRITCHSLYHDPFLRTNAGLYIRIRGQEPNTDWSSTSALRSSMDIADYAAILSLVDSSAFVRVILIGSKAYNVDRRWRNLYLTSWVHGLGWLRQTLEAWTPPGHTIRSILTKSGNRMLQKMADQWPIEEEEEPHPRLRTWSEVERLRGRLNHCSLRQRRKRIRQSNVRYIKEDMDYDRS